MTKKERQKIILEIIDKGEVATQEDIVKLLLEKGVSATQTTVSRDLHELGFEKLSPGAGKKGYIRRTENSDSPILGEKYLRVLREGLLRMDGAQNILVVKTVSGMAMAVAAAIDAMHFNEIVGSIAGDDTIMVVVREKEDTDSLMKKIWEYFI